MQGRKIWDEHVNTFNKIDYFENLNVNSGVYFIKTFTNSGEENEKYYKL